MQSSEPLDLPIYQNTGNSRPFPKKGTYTARTPEAFGAESFGASKAGYLTVNVSPTIVGGEYDGYQCRNTKVSAKTWTDKQTGAATSQLGRYLKACGVDEKISGSPQEQADAAERTANTLVQIDIDWYAQDRAHGFELKGMENFPKDANGNPTRFVPLDGEGGRPKVMDPITGLPVTVRAFIEVVRFRPLAQ